MKMNNWPASKENSLTHTGRIAGIKACVFDAYGTLFDVNSAAQKCADILGDHLEPLNEVWRAKQLQYTWLRSLMGRHADFWQVTGEALDYALAARGIEDMGLRERLMGLYLELAPFPEVAGVLRRLRQAGLHTAILSNGAPGMLDAAVRSAGLADLLDDVLSIEAAGIYKPHPGSYSVACDRLGLAAGDICFQSANAWDVAGAAAFGFHVVWVNRYAQPRERLPAGPEAEVESLAALPQLLGLGED